MVRIISKIFLIILSSALTGCAGKAVIPEPGKITLENAMRDVGQGLLALRQSEGNLRTGLIADEVVVTFNISATGVDNSKLYVEATPVITKPQIGGKATGETSTSYTATRGNQITIKMKNIMTADTSHITGKDTIPENINKMVEFIKSEGRKDLGLRERKRIILSPPPESSVQTQTAPGPEERSVSGTTKTPPRPKEAVDYGVSKPGDIQSSIFDPIEPVPPKKVTKKKVPQ